MTMEAGRPPDARETILLVEDEPAVRQLFAQALMRAGYRVLEARNGQEAVKVFDHHGQGHRPAPDRHADALHGRRRTRAAAARAAADVEDDLHLRLSGNHRPGTRFGFPGEALLA